MNQDGVEGDEWVVSGQKVWTSGASVADLGILLARTNWDVPKHQGISMLVLPMTSQYRGRHPHLCLLPVRRPARESQYSRKFLW